MKRFYSPLVLILCLLLFFQTSTKAAADVTLTSVAVPSATVTQGSATNVLYIVKMVVASQSTTVNSVQVTFGGTHDADDLTVMYVYFNPTAPTITGATLLNGLNATFAAPHTYNVSVNQSLGAGTTGYFIITANINPTASDGKTIKIDGAANPVVFGFAAVPNLTNSQTNAAGTFTIQAADVTVSSVAVPTATVIQGSATNVVYIAKMDVATEDVTVNNVQVTFGGTHDADDLTVMYVYFNPTAPTIAGSTLINGLNATFAAPHTYNVSVSRPITAGSGGYFIITANINPTASDGKTIHVDGATSPVVFGFTTGPNITNNQTNAAGTLTIQAADVTVSSVAVPAATVTQGSATNVVYIAKMDVATEDVTVNNVQVTFGGTHDADDLTVMYVYFNPTAPTIAGSTLINGLNATFAAPHTYNVSVSRPITAGSGGYFIITANINPTASDGKTIHVDGAASPVVFGFTTGPNITNNQTNAAGTLTIQAADVTVSSVAVPAATVTQGSATNVVYIAKMDVATEDVTVNNVQVTFGGTHDADDLTVMYVYFNPTAPTIAGSTLINGLNATFAAPHIYNVSVSRPITAGSGGYFIITANINPTASDGKTIHVDGATSPVVFGFTTGPNITNNQTNAAGTLTIQAADVTVSSVAVPAATIKPGTATNIVYIAKMDVATEDVTVNNVQVTFGGTHDADDLTVMYVYFNPTAPTIAGSTLLNGLNATFAAPHTYNVSVSRPITAGSGGYFIITVNTSATATIGNTIKVNGNTNPVVFGFTTGPNIIDNQTDIAGLQTLPVNMVSLTAKAVNGSVEITWVTASEMNNASFEVERSSNGVDFKTVGRIPGNGNTTVAHSYSIVDRSPEYGNNYYRIKQTDIDSHFVYSKIVQVAFMVKELSLGRIYPNPVKKILNYSLISSENKTVLLQLSDMSGRVLLNKTISIAKGTNRNELDISRYASGNYQLNIIDTKQNVRLNQGVVIVK